MNLESEYNSFIEALSKINKNNIRLAYDKLNTRYTTVDKKGKSVLADSEIESVAGKCFQFYEAKFKGASLDLQESYVKIFRKLYRGLWDYSKPDSSFLSSCFCSCFTDNSETSLRSLTIKIATKTQSYSEQTLAKREEHTKAVEREKLDQAQRKKESDAAAILAKEAQSKKVEIEKDIERAKISRQMMSTFEETTKKVSAELNKKLVELEILRLSLIKEKDEKLKLLEIESNEKDSKKSIETLSNQVDKLRDVCRLIEKIDNVQIEQIQILKEGNLLKVFYEGIPRSQDIIRAAYCKLDRTPTVNRAIEGTLPFYAAKEVLDDLIVFRKGFKGNHADVILIDQAVKELNFYREISIKIFDIKDESQLKLIDEITKDVVKAIHALPIEQNVSKRQGVLVPGGHSNRNILDPASHGHSVVYMIEREDHGKEERFSFTIINTGEGAPISPLTLRESDPSKWRTTDIKYTSLSIKEISLCLNEVLKYQCSFKNSNMDVVHKTLEKHLCQNNNANKVAGRTHRLQRKGACALKCIISWLYGRLGREIYRQFDPIVIKRTMVTLTEEMEKLKTSPREIWKLFIFGTQDNKVIQEIYDTMMREMNDALERANSKLLVTKKVHPAASTSSSLQAKTKEKA